MEEAVMSELSDNPVTAALTFKVPQKVSWAIQSLDNSWTGTELAELVECLTQETRNRALTLSLSLIFELTGHDGTVRSSSGTPPGGNR